MPLYEYQCRDCATEFEKLVPMSQADKPAECPECGGKRSRRLLSKIRIGASATSSGGSSQAVSSSPFS